MNQVNALPPPQPVRPMRPAGNEINIFDYIGVILRRWKIIILALSVIFAIVALQNVNYEPRLPSHIHHPYHGKPGQFKPHETKVLGGSRQ